MQKARQRYPCKVPVSFEDFEDSVQKSKFLLPKNTTAAGLLAIVRKSANGLRKLTKSWSAMEQIPFKVQIWGAGGGWGLEERSEVSFM